MNDKYLLHAIGSWLKQQRKANLCWCQFSFLKFIIAIFIFAFDHLRRFQFIFIANCQSNKNRFCCSLFKCFKIYNQSLCQFALPTRNRKSIKLQSFPKRCNGEFDWRSEELDKFWFNSIKWLARLFVVLDEEAPIWASQLPTCVENRANIPSVVALNPSQPESLGALRGSDPMKCARRPSRLNTIHITGMDKRHRITIESRC